MDLTVQISSVALILSCFLFCSLGYRKDIHCPWHTGSVSLAEGRELLSVSLQGTSLVLTPLVPLWFQLDKGLAINDGLRMELGGSGLAHGAVPQVAPGPPSGRTVSCSVEDRPRHTGSQ